MHDLNDVPSLEELVTSIEGGANPAETLMNVVALIAKHFGSEVCSAYLLEPDRTNLILAATVGLRRECIGTLRLGLHEGLVGLVAEQLRAVAVEQAQAHPRFKYFRDAGEEPFQSFLGVPLIDNGVLVDALLRTSDPAVYAAGDVANAEHPGLGKRIRVEHWANAQNQGKAAGASMAGKGSPYERVPYFYTDQFDLGMEYSGYGPLASGVAPIFRGDREGRKFVAFWLRDDRVVAGMNVNVWKVNHTVQKLIRSRAVVDPARLADPAMPLEALAGVTG